MGKRANDFVGDHAGPVENFPKFNSRGGTLPSGQAGSASQISGQSTKDGAGERVVTKMELLAAERMADTAAHG